MDIDPVMNHEHMWAPAAPHDLLQSATIPKKRSGSYGDQHDCESIKRGKNDENDTVHGEPYCLVVHEVTCSRHEGHGVPTIFMDTPRLFAGDNKSTPLHGKFMLRDDVFGESYAEENPDVSFIVLRSYDCGAYHELMNLAGKFNVLSMPAALGKALQEFKSQLTFISEDGEEAKPVSEKILFLSQDMDKAMTLLNKEQPVQIMEERNLTSIDAPYVGIYHAMAALRNHVQGRRTLLQDNQRAHISCLLQYISDHYDEEYEEADSEFASGIVSRQHFPKLFGPNQVVVRDTDAGPVGYTIADFPHTRVNGVELICWTWSFDGKFYKEHAVYNVEWPSEQPEVKVDSLPLFPLEYGGDDLKELLRRRGTRFWTFRSRKLVEYEAPTARFDFQTASNRYMIDLDTYKQMHPASVDPHDESDEMNELKDVPNANFLSLLPATVRGFGFHDKKWNTLVVERIRDVNWSNDIFERRLVLKPLKKELIKALVTVHNSTAALQKSDIVDGKGKGLILLLHGSPGTGKTLSAESIAEYAERPLYRVTCGDIGTDPENVEKYLESVLYIGALWRCVVLLDEADVFLEERTPTDLQRNALVSVFLRTLEYFEGILILTSNRVGTFDEAFMSRVQLAMHYPPLAEKDRWEVWSMFFRDILHSDERPKYDELKDKLDVLARYQLNGRQIRNIINTARQLARYRKEILGYTHIDQALEVANEFKEYIASARGYTDEEYAKTQGHR